MYIGYSNWWKNNDRTTLLWIKRRQRGNSRIRTKRKWFFTKFNVDFDTAITHLKFTAKNGDFLEVRKEKEETKKTHSFIGYYNQYGLKALGCKYISRKDFILINLMGILRLRHFFKINKAEKEKWENPIELAKLTKEMKIVAKICVLPEAQFASIMKFCA